MIGGAEGQAGRPEHHGCPDPDNDGDGLLDAQDSCPNEAEIINGNIDRTFRPVGEELDGLSNGLNVMLARLLGRPEPGDEDYDEDGNPMQAGRVEFDEGDARPAGDPDLAALAQEPEPDYYKRVFTEYTEAKRAAGTPDEVSFEGFIAKLCVNEGRLKAQFQCKAVRFRVVAKDGKVSLTPVPIV